MRRSSVNMDLHMANRTLNSKIVDHNNVFLNFFWRGYHVSCYWHPHTKEISLINSRYNFSDNDIKDLIENFTNAQWGF